MSRHSMILRIVALGLAAGLFACSAPPAGGEASTEFVLGTVCSVRVVEGPSKGVAEAVFARLRAIEERMSANKDGTEIAAVNAAAGEGAVVVSPDTFFVLSKALEYAKLSGGAFDPSIGPLVKLWGIGTESARVPAPAEIAAALHLVDYRKVLLDPAARSVRLADKGMALDLGAIAKGYAADEARRILSEKKVKAAIIDLGGNVFAHGKKKDGSPWRVGIQDPDSSRGEFIGIVSGYEESVVTSGVYERNFVEKGELFHHILDTKTGYPVRNGLVSTTIVAKASIDADGLSTTLFALGREKGLALAETLPGVEVVMIDEARKVYMTTGAGSVFKITNPAYTLSE